MILPLHVTTKIQECLAVSKTTHIQKAQTELSLTYRTPGVNSKKLISSDAQNLAYLATRLPATYAVCWTILQILKKLKFTPTSLLDVCAGPGTATLACSEIFTLKEVFLIDYDAHFKRFAQEILEPYPYSLTYTQADLTQQNILKTADIVILSYGLNELTQKDKRDILLKLWQSTQKFLVLIEPGTPKGFANIKEARTLLIQENAKIVAPCTHEHTCPMSGRDWCHFSVRLPRAPFHQRIKGASLNYEDEKYSYVILSKEMPPRPTERIIKKVMHHSGHTILDTCTPDGLQRTIVSKQQKGLYKQARHAEWGDDWPPAEVD